MNEIVSNAFFRFLFCLLLFLFFFSSFFRGWGIEGDRGWGACTLQVNDSAVISEPCNINTLNHSIFDSSYGKGILNSFDILIVSKSSEVCMFRTNT